MDLEQATTPELAEIELISAARLHNRIFVLGVDDAVATFAERVVKECGASDGDSWAPIISELRSGIIKATAAALVPRDADRVKRDGARTIVKLSRPIREVATVVDSITLRHPSGKDLTKCDGLTGFSYKMGLIAACTGLDVGMHVEKMAGHDILLAYEEACLILGKPDAP